MDALLRSMAGGKQRCAVCAPVSSEEAVRGQPAAAARIARWPRRRVVAMKLWTWWPRGLPAGTSSVAVCTACFGVDGEIDGVRMEFQKRLARFGFG
jgi:hypothetical protein